MEHWPGVSMVTAIRVRELDLSAAPLSVSFTGELKVSPGASLSFAKCCAGIVNDDGGNGLGTGINQLDCDHVGAAAREEGKQQAKRNNLSRSSFLLDHARSQHGAVAIVMQLKGKTRMFQFQRLFFFGR